MNVDELVAIDVHVHLEHEDKPTETDAAAKKYFGSNVAAQGAQALADYYRSRKMACVVFTVDEHLTGRPHLTNEEILAFAAANADIAIPFVSVDPTRGASAVAEAQAARRDRRRPRAQAASAAPAVLPQRPPGLSGV